MLKKTITYTDYNDVERTEDFYFNFTTAELKELELGTTGGLSEMARKIIATKDMPNLVKLIKEMILKAYGEKSADGRRFMKSEEISNEFAQTEAYSILFMELTSDDVAAATFFNGIMPKEISEAAAKSIPEKV